MYATTSRDTLSPILELPPIGVAETPHGDTADHDAAVRSRDGGDGDDAISIRRGAQERRRLTAALVAGKEGDPAAIRYLYERYSADVYGYVRSILRDDHEAEDITQNVFIKLMRILPKYEERAVPFSAWLLRVARNAALDHLRARRAIPCEDVRDVHPDAGDSDLDRAWSLRCALSTLSAEQRRVVLWRHLVGLSPVEIAARLGRTEGSVHALHHRGRRTIQAELRAMGAAPSTVAAVASVPAGELSAAA